ncbi:MAG: hypothetical protein JJU07_16185 [Natronohydrobacter sp.]|nr:hypothetical protein [Natronohydrobacter sp.]
MAITTNNTMHEIAGYRVEMMTGKTGVFDIKVFEIDDKGDGHFCGYAEIKVKNYETTEGQILKGIMEMRERQAMADA